MKTTLTKLPNGATVACAPMQEVESAVIGIWVRNGSRYEEEAVGGVSHFIEHLLFKGTRKRTAAQISEAVEGVGGELNAFTTEDNTCYYARFPYDKLDHIFEVLSDMYLHPAIPAKELERERGVVIEEIRMYQDQPQTVAMEQLNQQLWSNHPLGRPITGTVETIRHISRNTIESYRRRACTPAATIYVFAGRVDPKHCVELVRKATEKQTKQPCHKFQRVTTRTRLTPFAITRRDIEQIHAAVAFRLPFGREHKTRYALRLLSCILGENMSSRLFQRVREEAGLCYTISSFTQLFDETSALCIYAGLDSSKAKDGLSLAMRETTRLARERISETELRRAKDYVCGTFRLGIETASARSSWLGGCLSRSGRITARETTIAGLEAVSAEEIQVLAQQIFIPDRLALSLVVPKEDGTSENAWQAALTNPIKELRP
ncbi:MAG: pitrilysin family protein [Kiritimatiellia bacterium]|nr:pitrilysin family protein [Kiritimatiellia bacterium]